MELRKGRESSEGRARALGLQTISLVSLSFLFFFNLNEGKDYRGESIQFLIRMKEIIGDPMKMLNKMRSGSFN
jgi:hypothetical protein